MHLNKSSRPLSPLQIESAFEEFDEDEDVVVASQALSLLSSSSILRVVGCDLVGILMDLTL